MTSANAAPERLDAQQLERLLPGLPLWQHGPERGGILTRDFVFQDFAQAIGFMAQVAVHAEKRNHHPEWFNVYNRVTVTLTTHDVEGLSTQDVDMAGRMDRIAATLAAQAR